MNRQTRLAKEWVERIILTLGFLLIGGVIIVVFSPLRPVLDPVPDYLGRIGITFILLFSALLIRRSRQLNYFWQVVYGLFVLSVTVSLDWVFAVYLLEILGIDGNTPAGFALLKLNECAVVVGSVILFTRLSGESLGSIYIQKGRLKLGLTIGLVAFFLAAVGSVPMSSLLFKADSLSFESILPWLPWLLIFVLANATQEELLFRGLFLRKLEPFFGKLLSSLLIAITFTLLHKGVTYTSSELIFLAVLFQLALAWGYIMQKTDGVWGSILFHAGMDIPIMLGIFANLT
jgi:membrane protease YdiL (CAAX protease family)